MNKLIALSLCMISIFSLSGEDLTYLIGIRNGFLAHAIGIGLAYIPAVGILWQKIL